MSLTDWINLGLAVLAIITGGSAHWRLGSHITTPLTFAHHRRVPASSLTTAAAPAPAAAAAGPTDAELIRDLIEGHGGQQPPAP